MNIEGVKRPEDLPFPVNDDVRDRINEMLDAKERDDILLDCYEVELELSARDFGGPEGEWIKRYYLQGGWRRDVKGD